MWRRRLIGLASAVLVAGGAGCGSSSGDSEAEAPTPKATTKPSTGTASKDAATKTAKDTIEDFTFSPGSVTVTAGGSVMWTNKDSANHNVVFDDKSVEGIGNLRENQSGKVKFAQAGTYAYVCTYHPGMKGKVVVK